MVRLLDSTQLGKNKQGKIIHGEYAGLSTDNKPTENIVTGSSFVEVDTGDIYLFDEASSTWTKIGE